MNAVIRKAQVSWIMRLSYHKDHEEHEGSKMT